MIKNYFFLNRFIVEANKILNDAIVSSIFSQEKDKMIIELKRNNISMFLEISTNPGFPYITIKDKFNRAKKNTIDLFQDCVSSKLIAVEISKSDRVLKINLDSGSIFFAVRGKFTNVSFISNDGVMEHFKNPPEDFDEKDFLDEIKSTRFINGYNFLRLELLKNGGILDELKAKYPFVGKEIITETKSRIKNDEAEEIITKVTRIIEEIFYESPAVFLDDNNLQIHLAVASFSIFPCTKKIIFEELIPAFNYYIGKKYYFEQLAGKKKKIQKHLEKELLRLSSKLNKLKGVIDRGSNEEEYYKLGNLLLINISSIRKGMSSIVIADIYDENKLVTVKLNDTLPPKKNVDLYFEKAKNDKIKYEKSQQLFNEVSKTYFSLKDYEQKLLAARALEDYNSIMKELKIKDENNSSYKGDDQSKFKHYIIENKYHVFVGKDSRNNDLLTTKFAKQNDYWFHARSVPGSHVVLRVENTKEVIPKNILKKAASLAAYHSKAKTAGIVPVSFTLKKYVVKKKGMEAGKVALLKEDVLLVNPEIPPGCEYILNE